MYTPVHLNAYSNFCAALVVLPVALWQLLKISESGGLASVGWQGWGAVLYMGVLASAICFWLYFWALRSMAASQLASLNYLQPFFATLLGVALLGEKLTTPFLAGGALVIAGVYIIQSRRMAAETQP
jgi:drug/metabolite transporter (DMT)-like permease